MVLGISGSPRKDGNTDIAVKMVLDLIGRREDVSTEFIRVADFDIKHCQGCRQCMVLGHCAIEDDDYPLLRDKLFSADVVVVGAPVYWNGPPGVMKDFIDRTHGFYLDHARLSGKKVALISVAADGGFESHEKTLSWMRVYDAEIIGKVRVYAREKGELLRKPEEIEKIEELVDILLRKI